MPLLNDNQETSRLEERISELEKKLKDFEKHQHLGDDGSRELAGETLVNCKGVEIHGAGLELRSGLFKDPLIMYDHSGDRDKPKRAAGMGVATTGVKEAANEQINAIITAGKVVSSDQVENLNRTDFSSSNIAQLVVINSPFRTPISSGPSSLSSLSFVLGSRTPFVLGSGSTTIGGNTLTDSTAKFIPDQLVGCILNLRNSAGSTIETRKITSNTDNVITVSGAWTSATGTYVYLVTTPMILGAVEHPWSRLFVGEDIRLGYGSSGGSQVQYIKWGSGSPEGVVTANVGSMYLRSDGGAGATLYIKETGTGNTGWVAK